MSSSDSSRPVSRTPKPVAPTEPKQEECCGNDCGKGCVFEVYERKMERYECRLAEWQANEDECVIIS